MSRVGQIPRQWRILRRLETHKYGVTAIDLAEQENCLVRTVYRDLSDLEEAGFPLIQERRGKRSFWKLAFHRDSPKVPFTFSEMYALCLSRDRMKLFEGTELYTSICSAVEKIKSTLPPGILEHLESFSSNVTVRSSQEMNFSSFNDYMKQINSALDEGTRVRLTYFSPEKKSENQRKVDPYQLWIQDGAMYLVGYCHLRHSLRTFHLARIRSLIKLEEPYELPNDFDLEDYLSSGFRTMTGEVMEVEILFAPQIRHVAYERVWHPTQHVEEREKDGHVVVRFRASGLSEIKTWVLGFGSKVEVLKPSILKEAVEKEIQESYSLYFSSK